MKRIFTVMAMVMALAMSVMGAAIASSTTIYDTIPEDLPSTLPSLGYQASQTAELGKHITFDSTERDLGSATVTMVSWACADGVVWTDGCGAITDETGESFEHPVTFSIYEVGDDGAVGEEIGTVTQDVNVPFRPAADDTCDDPRQWSDDDGACNFGHAFNVTFDLDGVTVPDAVIYGIAFNTRTWGYDPIGEPGGYDSLNVGLVASDNEDQLYRAVGSEPVFGPEGGLAGWDPSVRFVTVADDPDPVVDDCKGGGFADFGFRNQGQCIASIVANENASLPR